MANDTEAREAIISLGSNSSSSTSGSAEASNISIVRSGIQSSEAMNGLAATLSSTDTTSLKQTAPEPRQDVAANQAGEAQTTAGSTSPTVAGNHRHHAAHSNHQNYPNEPYPSASYTALSVHHSPSDTFVGNFNSSLSSAAGSHSLLADREYHNPLASQADSRLQQTLLADHLLTGYTSQQLQNPYQSALFGSSTNDRLPTTAPSASMRNGLSGSYHESTLNQALVSLASAAAMPSITLNDNNQIFSSPPAPLNASLIQNLTAGLFPVNKLSNVTMLSLGELLSKTRQTPEQPGSSQNHRPSSEFDSFDYLAGAGGNQASGSYSLPSDSNQANYLEALLGDSRFNSMLDLLVSKPSQTSPPPSQFGFRDPSAVARYQTQPSGLLHRNNQQISNPFLQATLGSNTLSKESRFDSPQVIVGTRAYSPNQQLSKPSNVYNTYLPFKDQNVSKNKPMTNGQMLNMAATLYDNYLDQNYRYPLTAKQQQQQNLGDAANDHSSSNNNNRYQFIQHHNSQNQNHLDKIVYHSTPFRPSIVSPPPPPPQQQQQQTSGTLTLNSTQQGNHQSYQRPKTEADSKSMSYATLGANNRIISGNSRPQPDFGTNSSRAQQGKFEPIRQHENELEAIYDHLNEPQSSYKHQMNHTASSNNQQTQVGYNATASNKLNVKKPALSLQEPAASSGSQLLLDLYERAIDNQILEAIYSDHRQHFQHLGPSASAGSAPSSPQTSASMNYQSNWPFDESLASPFQTSEPSFGRRPSVSGPVGLGHQASSHHYALGVPLANAAASPVVASTSISQSSLIDPLAGALQELPTFSASDLQPLLPATDTNSMLMSPTQVPHSTLPLNLNAFAGQPATAINDQTPDATSLASFAAQLFSPLGTASSSASTTSSYGQLFGDNDMATSSYIYDSRVPASSQLQVQQLAQSANSNGSNQNSNNNNNNLSLPALLAKLQTSQFSSILTSPIVHLYANLPRYRHAKAKQPSGQTRSRNTNGPHQASKMNKQQAAAAMAAATAANLIAASGHTLTPLQAAMIQAQAATRAYLNTEPLMAQHTNGHPSSVEAVGLQKPTLSQQASSLALSSLASGLAGGGVSPQVWRNILGPWQKKQAGGQANSSSLSSLLQQNSYGSQSPNQPMKAPMVSAYHQPGRLAHAIWNGNQNQLPFSQLLSASQSQPSSSPLVAPSASEQQKRPPPSRLRIKILKIPVAFYETSSPSSGLADETSGIQNEASAPSISLMPVHLQPSPTASLLASLSCPLHSHHQQQQQQQQMSPFFSSSAQPSLSASTSIYSMPPPSSSAQHQSAALNHQTPFRFSHFPYQFSSADQSYPLFTGMKQASTSDRSSSTQSSASLPSAGKSSSEKLTPMRDFTDINQPNDLQVSPSGAANTLSTLVGQQQQQQQQQQQFLTTSS